MAIRDRRGSTGGSDTEPLGRFLFSYLRDLGVRHCFGIPGDYVLTLYKAMEATPGIEPVVATHEPCAALSADAYGRSAGLGVLLVTYGVGGFNAMNGVACAHAESSPLLVISGGPRTGSGAAVPPFAPATHHFVKHASSQLEAYRHITDLALRIESPAAAATMIRQAATHAMRAKLPVYLEIPTDLMNAEIPVADDAGLSGQPYAEGIEQAVAFFVERLCSARNPVILAGVEVGRYGLQPQVRRIMTARHIPVATSVLGKGVFDETEPGVLGMYAGVISQSTAIRQVVEGAGLVVMLGMKVTDVNCGASTANLTRDRLLIAKSGWVGDGYMRFASHIALDDFVTRLAEEVVEVESSPDWPVLPAADLRDSPNLMDRYLAEINAHLDGETMIVADTGDACYGSLFMTVRRENGYLAPTFYNTMGFAVPAALGAQLADAECRPVVLVGDGAFQMTGLEFSNLVSWGSNAIVVLFNNSGYGMQRIFVDGEFNDIRQWDYSRVIDLVGGGRAWRVDTSEEMGDAFRAAQEHRSGPSLIEAVVPKGVISTGLDALGKALHREKSGACPLNTSDVPCDHESRCSFCRAVIWR